MSDLISVIVPVYNAEKYLRKCIESIIKQTYSNLEIILINDGSEDDSKNICDEFALKDERIVLIHKKNEGVGSARNDGLNRATGKYIAFVDCDDYIEKDTIEILYNNLIEKNVDCVKGNYDIIINENAIQNNELKLDKQYNKDEIKEFVNILLSEKVKSFLWLLLIKKDCIKDNFSKELFLYEDVNFYISFLGNINSIYVFSKVIYHYVITENSLSRDTSKIYSKIENLKLANIILKESLKKYNFDSIENIKAIDTRIINNIINYYYYIYKTNNKFKELIDEFEENRKEKNFKEMLKNYDENILTKKEKIFNNYLINKKYFRFWILCKIKNVLTKIRKRH